MKEFEAFFFFFLKHGYKGMHFDLQNKKQHIQITIVFLYLKPETLTS